MFIPSLTLMPPVDVNGTTTVLELLSTAESPYKFIGPTHLVQSASVQLNCNAALEEISTLEDDWDGYGALAPTTESYTHVKLFLAGVGQEIPAPDVSPTSNGTINLEWQSNEGLAFLEVGQTRYSGHIQPRRGVTIFFEGQLSQLQESFATQQVLAMVKQFLYGASGSKIPSDSVRFFESAL
jgi:hypothetical protein